MQLNKTLFTMAMIAIDAVAAVPVTNENSVQNVGNHQAPAEQGHHGFNKREEDGVGLLGLGVLDLKKRQGDGDISGFDPMKRQEDDVPKKRQGYEHPAAGQSHQGIPKLGPKKRQEDGGSF